MENSPLPRTPEEISNLKKNWIHDPCWDLHKTEGFEEHAEELRQFQDRMETHWQVERDRRRLEWAKKFSLENNLPLADFLKDLDRRIDRILELLEAKN